MVWLICILFVYLRFFFKLIGIESYCRESRQTLYLFYILTIIRMVYMSPVSESLNSPKLIYKSQIISQKDSLISVHKAINKKKNQIKNDLVK